MRPKSAEDVVPSMDDLVNNLKNFKEVIGMVGLFGSIINFWAKLNPKYAIPIGIVCALFILIWGLLESRNDSSIVRAFVLLGIIISVIAEICFLGIGSIMLLRSPTDIGKEVQKTNEEFVLNRNRRGDQVSDVYKLKLVRKSSFVDIGITPALQDVAAVEDLEVTPQVDPIVANKITEVVNKASGLQTYYRLAEPISGASLDFLITATLKQPTTSSQTHIRITCTYMDRDFLWEVRQWVFRNLGW